MRVHTECDDVVVTIEERMNICAVQELKEGITYIHEFGEQQSKSQNLSQVINPRICN